MQKFDLHIHSTCSKHKLWGIDGINPPEEIVEVAVKTGLQGIAITDHNTLMGTERAIKFVKTNKIDIFIIPGAEIRSNAGDILALGISEDIQKNLPILDTIDAIKDQGGIAIAAHPYKYNTNITQFLNPSIELKFDALEIFNAGVTLGRNHKARLLADKLKIPGIAVSDAHYKSSIGYTYTTMDPDVSTVDEALRAIQKGNITIHCKYPPLANAFYLYSRKMFNLFKKVVKKGNHTC